jgi:hypothetical protein
MDAGADFRPDLAGFLEDIECSFRTHGGRSAAVVWPQGEASVVQALVAAHEGTESSAGETVHLLARDFGELVNRHVDVGYRTVPARHVDEERDITTDTFAVLLKGVVEVQLSPRSIDRPEEMGQIRHRLLVGEVLYIPAGFSCVVSGQHSFALIMELTLGNRGTWS